ncbi:MAG TPA: YggT family protein [Candidatus Peribacterales bacterium]|nr:YggT family protein [Candidatus Peribacterales bacterium]
MKRYISMPFSLLYFLIDVVALVLTIRFLFKLFGANSGNMFVSRFYALTEPLIMPFQNIFPPLVVPSLGVLEWSILIAAFIYLIAVLFLLRILSIAFYDDVFDDESHMHHISHAS